MVDDPSERGDDEAAKAQERRRLVWRLAAVAAGVLVLLVLLVLVVVVLPPRFTAHRSFDKDHEELKAQNDVRTTLLQGLGALLVLTGAAIGASVAYRGVRETRRQIAQTAADNQEQFKLTRQGQITDRYTRAVEQLGREKAPVRLGALYSLGHLAQDNPEYRQTVVDVVCAYLRMPFTPPGQTDPDAEQVEELQVRRTAQRLLTEHLRCPPKTSSQKAQLPPSPQQAFWPGISLELTGATLIDFNLPQGSVIRARFDGATFEGDAWFDGATFQGDTWFGGATFKGNAKFGEATFQGDAGFGRAIFKGYAWFGRATFQGAWFDGATFQGAGFGGATFQGDAGFDKATFQGNAKFDKATFQGDAKFDKATFQGDAWFGKATFQGAGFGGATFQGDAGFGEATFQGDARFDKATFQGAWFGGATFQGAGFDEATFQGDARFDKATFQGDARFNKATFQGDARFNKAHVLHSNDRDRLRVWPDGWTVLPDPTNPSRGTLVKD